MKWTKERPRESGYYWVKLIAWEKNEVTMVARISRGKVFLPGLYVGEDGPSSCISTLTWKGFLAWSDTPVPQPEDT
jgi:hypothetical protein